MPRHMKLSRAGDLGAADASALETLAVIGAAVAALYFGRAIAIPIAIAVLISFSLGPLVAWLRHHHMGRLPAILAVVVPALVAAGALAYIVTTEVGHLVANLPDYQSNIERKLGTLEQSLPARDMLDRGSAFLQRLQSRTDRGNGGLQGGGLPASNSGSRAYAEHPLPVVIEQPNRTPLGVLEVVVGPLVTPFVDFALILLFVVFFLFERENLRDRIIRLAGAHDLHRTTMAMDEAGYRVSRYLLQQLIVNMTFGIAITLGLLAIGLPNAALWGGIAGILRFIPYLGVVAASALPIALAFAVDPGWATLLWTVGLFLCLELLVGNVVEPWLYGTSTGVSAVALVLSAIFWTWLWGSIGLLLATPLTVCIAVLGRHVPQLRFLDIVLGNEAPLRPEESFYQRLLAGDPDEASEQAEDFLKTRPLLELDDEVVIPALVLAERDRARGVLDGEGQDAVVTGLTLVFQNIDEEIRRARGRSPPDTAEEPAQQSEPPGTGTILCVGGRGNLDEAASQVLARYLTIEGYHVETLSLESALKPFVGPELPQASVVCLSYMDPESVPHARYLGRRFRRALGSDASLLVIFWGADQGAMVTGDLQKSTGADSIATSLASAVAVIDARLKAEGPAESGSAHLDSLAEKASRMVSQTA